jgi:hypothetical protein
MEANGKCHLRAVGVVAVAGGGIVGPPALGCVRRAYPDRAHGRADNRTGTSLANLRFDRQLWRGFPAICRTKRSRRSGRVCVPTLRTKCAVRARGPGNIRSVG